jgi:hypothetical protein
MISKLIIILRNNSILDEGAQSIASAIALQNSLTKLYIGLRYHIIYYYIQRVYVFIFFIKLKPNWF